MLGRAVAFTILASLCLAAPAQAHDTIPADWCPVGSTPVILADFVLTLEQLRQYRGANEKRVYEDCLQAKTCGIIDDWFWANDAAGTYCSALGLRASTPEDAIPFVTMPKSFDAVDHHAAYDFDDGTLRGQCVVCRSSGSSSQPPVEVPPPTQ